MGIGTISDFYIPGEHATFIARVASVMARSSASANPAGASSPRSDPSGRARMTLDDVMRAPSTNVPGVVVLDSTHAETDRKDVLNPREDLWLSSVDG